MSLTERVNARVKLQNILKLCGARNEKREYRLVNGEQYFGNYTIEHWERFKKDIEENGLKYPITVWVEDGKITLAEGNHRIKAFEQLGIDYIDVEISCFYGSEKVIDYKRILEINN